MRRVPISLTAALLALLAAAPGHAQRPVHLGIAGGLSMPQGTFATLYETGYHGRAFAELSFPAAPFRVRAGAEYERFESKPIAIYGSSAFSLLGAAAELVYDLASMPLSSAGPYAIVGAGLYRVTNGVESDAPAAIYAPTGDRDLAWHIGLGARIDLGPVGGFLEARYRSVRLGDGATMFPVSVGLRL